MKEYRSIKLWMSTYRLLKVIAATNGETLAALIDRLATQEKANQDARHTD